MLNGGQPAAVPTLEIAPQTRSPYQTTIERIANDDPQSEAPKPVPSPTNAPVPSPDPFSMTAPPAEEFEFEKFPTPPLAMTTSGNDRQPLYTEDHNAEMQAAVQSFVPPAFATLDTATQQVAQPFVPQAPRYVPPPPRHQTNVIESEYKPSLWSWIKDLPTLAKVAVIVVVFSICFAVALKGFMTMDVSIAPSLGATEPQKAWFSSWFRSQPTPEEILKKYETETNSGTKAIAQSYLISGIAQFISTPPDGTLDPTSVRKQFLGLGDQTTAPVTPPTATPNTPNRSAPSNPQPWDFDVNFEMAMKSPNKMLMKMVMKPKPGFTQAFRAFQAVGFDGDRGWNYSKTYVNGRETVKEGQFQPKNFIFSRHKDGISLAFLGSQYPKAELIGMDVAYNRLAYNVKLTDENGVTNALYDIETGMLARMTREGEDVFVLQHEAFDGVKLPSKMIIRVDRGWLYLHIQKVETNVGFEDTIFLRSSQ